MAKKAKAKTGSGTLGEIAASLGSLLGNAEKQWRAWQGPRDAVVRAVTDVRDRAAALLSEMGAAADAATSKGSKKDKKAKKDKAKKDKKDRDKKDRKDKKAKAEKAKAEKAQAGKTAKAGKAEKKTLKDGKKARRKTGEVKKTRARTARTVETSPAAAPVEAPVTAGEADFTGSDAGDTGEP